MSFNEWIKKVIETGNLCGGYTDKVHEAKSKKKLMDVCLDSNGASWLPEMQAKGMPLPYETILKEFGSYINGRYKAEFKNEKGHGYTSSIYCCYAEDECLIDTTLTTMLCCNTDVYIRENDFVKIYADKNCELHISCPDSSRCIVEYWEGAKIVVHRGVVEKIKHTKEGYGY